MPKYLEKYNKREDGFTLVELLIVVLIIGILAAIAIPVYLGIQNNSFKSAVRADVNISVKRVQVALTENAASMAEIKTNQAPYKQQSVKGEVVQILDSTTSGASSSDYLIKGVVSTSTTPAGPINYSYIYDSVSGKFTESDAVVLGSSIPSTTITTSSLPNALKDTAYSATVSASTTNPGGTTVYSATGLPTTLTIDSATGKITGTPTATGTYSVTVNASNAGVSDSKNYTLNVYVAPSITTNTLPNPTQGSTYDQTLTATGTPSTGITFALTSGTLPTGLTLDQAAGRIYGTPTATGPFTFAIAASNTAGQGASQSYSVVVGSIPGITASTASTTAVWPAFSQIKYTPSEQPVTSGYPSPTVTAANLPAGLSIDNSTGAISGTPTTAGNYNFTLTATNSYGATTKNVTMNVLTGNNSYNGVVDWVRSDSVGTVNFYGWAYGNGSSDNNKANLRVDVYIDSQNYDFYSTNWYRPDVNSAYGGVIGNYHGYNINLNTTSGSHNMRIYLRDGTSAAGATKVFDGTVVVK